MAKGTSLTEKEDLLDFLSPSSFKALKWIKGHHNEFAGHICGSVMLEAKGMMEQSRLELKSGLQNKNSTGMECSLDPLNGSGDVSKISTKHPCEGSELVGIKRKSNALSDDKNGDLPGFKKETWNELCEPIDVPSNLSKRQRKKFIKKVLWETKWKPLKRAKEKEKLKKKRLEAREKNEPLGPSRKMLKQSTMASSNCKLRVALDFSFDDLMSEKDVGKCIKQLNLCYCLNRRAADPLQLHVTNFRATARDQMAKNTGYLNWDVNFHKENHLEIFSKEELVYLTSDSENVLTELDDKKIYIIGALVDHNKHKGITLNLANEQGISHAQLPIGEYLEMSTRHVLTINHVFEILLHVSSGISWKEALMKVIPQRKGAVEKLVT